MVFSRLIGHIKKDTISEKTCQNYMHKWEYKYNEKKSEFIMIDIRDQMW